jgi:hypothetical protein
VREKDGRRMEGGWKEGAMIAMIAMKIGIEDS